MQASEYMNTQRSYQLAIVGGDEIGPEVCRAALDVVKAAVGTKRTLVCVDYDAGADCYTKTGTAFPSETFQGSDM
jgi:3-isopropylmalate dehydrogenase